MRFGPFEIERPLGRGGMAETFVARYRTAKGFERTVCLKRILSEHAASSDFVDAFQEEAKLAMRLVHPHIAQVYDFGEVEGTWWMSLELVGGGDLRALLKALGQPMPVDLVLLLAIDLASALEYAHALVVDGRAADLVHRDVSPSNVLIDEQGNFKLVDFGIAKSTLSSSETTTGKIKGKACYMAPEQGLGRKLDRRTDLWALGVVLYEALAGVRPFEAATDLATILLVSQGERRTLADAAPHVPADVCAIVERLLTVDVDRRFQSASEVLEALEHRPPPPTARRRLAQILRRMQAGELRAESPRDAAKPSAQAGTAQTERTLAITSLALGAPEDEPVPSAPDDATRTRTVFDDALERSLGRGVLDATQRHDSLAPHSATAAPIRPAMAAAPSVVVSPEVSPEVSLARQEITETRPAFGRRALGWIVLGVGLAGLAAGGLIAAIVVWRLGAHAAVTTVAAAATDAGSDTPRAARDRDASAFDASAFDASVTDANAFDASVTDANAFDANAFDASVTDASGTSSALATSPRIDVAAPREADRGPRTTAAPREGRLEVVVVPWGRVEIDGTDVGRSPYRGTVATGSHRVEGVAGEERRTRTVRVTGRGVTRVQIAIE
jgi:serine/threonine protein kinase